MSEYIKFLNHASVVISNGNKSILTDPWYFGNVFDNGWSLLYENNSKEIENTLNNIDYIWLSHEHPDHFSIPFFKKYLKILKFNKINIIFQCTKDRRVINFLNSLGLQTIELQNNTFFQIDVKFKIKILKSEFYDSSLILKINDFTIFNLNDCPIEEISHIKNFKQKHGSCDLLLTQFSYAAWKGGEDNKKWRQEAANNKLKTIVNQAKILEASTVIPFASFIYFSNTANFYLNDSSNKIADLLKINSKENLNIVIMKPYEKQTLNILRQNPNSINFWKEIYNNLNNFDLIKFPPPISEIDLINSFKIFQKRTFKINSKLVIKIISKVPKLNFFSNQKIYLNDIKKTVILDLFNDLKFENKITNQVSMNSNTFTFLLNNSFGFDTLTINGSFKVDSFESFGKMAKFFAIGNLNNLGIRIGLFSIFNLKLLLLFLTRLRKVENYLNE